MSSVLNQAIESAHPVTRMAVIWNIKGWTTAVYGKAYAAGLACGGGGAADGGAAAAVVAAFFSTMRTARIEPSYSASKGIASEAWLSTSGGVSTAAMMKAITMK